MLIKYLTKMFAIDLARYIPLIAVVSYAAYSDYKTKHASNKIWLYAIYGLTITIIESALYLNYIAIELEVGTVLAAFAIAYGLFELKAWGGADAKALMTIAVSAPLFPSWFILPHAPIFPIGVFYIACVATLVYSIAHKSSVPLRQRKIQFLPFILIGLIVCVLL